jgi:hypothetical protein
MDALQKCGSGTLLLLMQASKARRRCGVALYWFMCLFLYFVDFYCAPICFKHVIYKIVCYFDKLSTCNICGSAFNLVAL